MLNTDAPTNSSQTVAVLGATGYIGGRLVPVLLEQGHNVVCVARRPERLAGRSWSEQVRIVAGDALDIASLIEAFDGVDAVYHLVHAMGSASDFAEADRQAAEKVRDAAAAAGVDHLVYLGGLGDDAQRLSPHLHSRHEVGEVLASGPVPTTELRAAIIIGSGSASFEMLRSLVDVLPAMVTPRWVASRCQPIAIRDVLTYLVGVLGHTPAPGAHEVFDIGGPDVLTYRDMMATYAQEAGLRRRAVVTVPFLTPRLSSHWVNLVTPLPIGLARPLIESQIADVLVRPEHDISAIIEHDPLPVREAIRHALRRVKELDIDTTWLDAGSGRPSDPYPGDPIWSGGRLLTDEQVVDTDLDASTVFAAVERIGGEQGWHAAELAWSVRGLLDEFLGGVGRRRGRLDQQHLRYGDPVDFFRVDAIDRPHSLRLRAEMKVPGAAWLEWRVVPTAQGARLHQKAIFWPRGIAGRLYWYGLLLPHRFIFGRMAQGIVAEAHRHERPTMAQPSGSPA